MRRAAWIAGGLLLALAVAAAIAVSQRRALAEGYVTRALASRGITASLAIAELGARGGVVMPLRLERPGLPPLEAARVAIDWTPGGLLGGHVRRVAVEGARLQG